MVAEPGEHTHAPQTPDVNPVKLVFDFRPPELKTVCIVLSHWFVQFCFQ